MLSPSPSGLGGPAERGTVDDGVRIVDTPAERVHHPGDLVGLVLSALGIGLVIVLALYAQGTTTGLTRDVQGFASVVQNLLFLPVALLEGVITFVVPVAVLTELLLRRLVRHAFEAVGAALGGILLALATAWAMTRWGTPELTGPFSVWSRGDWVVNLPALFTGTAALLTAAGARNRRRTAAWSWNVVWIGLGVALMTGLVTLPGALMTVLLGRVVGLAVRFGSGVQSERAYGASLVDGIRRAGFEPQRIVRISDVAAHHPDGEEALATDLAAVAIARYGGNRVYAMTTTEGDRLDVVVLDGDRQVVGMLTRFWRSLRLRGLDGRAVVSLRQAAERTALLSYAAWSAGVSTPRLLALAEAEDSMLLVQEHAPGAVPLRDVPEEDLTDELLDAVWEQLCVAHAAGLAHRALTSDVILIAHSPDVPDRPAVLLTGWDSGDVASSDLARRMDIAQMLAVLALRVGAERTVASAARALPDADLASVGPLLQAIALPRATREEARQNKGLLADVREALLAKLPEADVEPERLVRFGVRTVLTIALTFAVVVVLITTIQFDEIYAAFTASDEPWWAAVAFGLGLATFVGSALALVAFAPIKLPVWRVTLVQTAAAFVALVAPAGVGPAALNLRMLTRRGVASPLAAASVGLVQVSQLITTVGLLLVLSLLSGTQEPLQMPPTTVLFAVGSVATLGAAAMLVPRVRQWVFQRTMPVWRQTWPRLIQMLGQPRRLLVALIGNLIMTIGYLGAFYACLAAFGVEMSPIELAVVYLFGNAAGALAPTPGGLGAVEGALIAGLIGSTGPEVTLAIATSAVMLFRALTYWGRVPFGWLAMRALQRTGEL